MSAHTAQELIEHVGHKIEVVTYGDPAVNVAVECHTCNEVLVDYDTELVAPPGTEARLEELRAVLRSESISWGELAELQGLAAYIDPSDVELLEPAGVPEFPDEDRTDYCPACREPEHDSCPLVAGCPCCADTAHRA